MNNGEKKYEDGESFRKAVKGRLESAIGEMMVGWAEWKETIQDAFLYTIQHIINSLSSFNNTDRQEIMEYWEDDKCK